MRRQERACFPSTIPYLPRNYYRFHTDRDWGIATNYNLTLDSGGHHSACHGGLIMRRFLLICITVLTCLTALSGCTKTSAKLPTSADAPTSNFPNEPPLLAVGDDKAAVYAWRGTSSWMIDTLDGAGTGIQADSPHPLDCIGNIPVLSVSGSATLTLRFEATPNRILVRKYKANATNRDTYEEQEVKGTLKVEGGNYLYEVIATWDSSPLRSYSGTAHYAFCTVK